MTSALAKRLACLLLPASLWAAPSSSLAQAEGAAIEEAQPRSSNIVLIVADDLGWNDVGFHGSEIETPHIDGIARRGIELDRFYVQPSCSPTRAALMTGKSPARLGIVRPLGKLDPAGLPIEETLLPEYLREAAYQTFMAGRWHLGHAETPFFPHRRGFDHFYGHVTGGIEVVERMTGIVDYWPRGPEVHGSLWSVLLDPDRFGGEEDREPWADVAR